MVLACSATPLSDVELEYVPLALPGGMRPRELHGDGRRDAQGDRRRDDRPAQGRRRRADPLLRRPVHQHRPARRRASAASRSPPRRTRTPRSSCRSGTSRAAGSRRTCSSEMKVGDSVRFEGPLGSFFLREDSRQADHLRRRRHRLRAGEEHGRARVPRRHEAPDDPVLGRALARRPVPARAAAAVGGRASELHVRAGALGAAARGSLDRPHRASSTKRSSPTSRISPATRSTPAARSKMVEAAHPAFKAHGMSQDDCFSDAFRLAPHLRASPTRRTW